MEVQFHPGGFGLVWDMKVLDGPCDFDLKEIVLNQTVVDLQICKVFAQFIAVYVLRCWYKKWSF